MCGRTKLFPSLKEGERRKKEKRGRGEKEEDRKNMGLITTLQMYSPNDSLLPMSFTLLIAHLATE